jgi:transposase InsO family protein
MEEQWQVDRARLWRLQQEHPDWTHAQYSQAVGRCVSWVKKWRTRFKTVDPGDEARFKSHSRRPKNTGSPIKPAVIDRILAIRDQPPEGLKRIPGPVAIKYYLHKQEKEDPLGCYLPTSSSTIWAILNDHHRIIRADRPEREPTVLAEPLQVWQIDFKDVSTVKPQPEDKKQHYVETLNMLDTGTSILMDNPARTDFNAETVIRTVTQSFKSLGCPRQITFDRDPRFVASASSDGFPAPFVRFLACVGITPNICPPQRPDKNGYVERFNRTYDEEGIRIYDPHSYDQVVEMNLDIRFHYNFQRPNQARSCGNQPPRLAFDRLPKLPALPTMVDPDRWLQTIDGQLFKRRVNHTGSVKVDKHSYYIGRAHRGRYIVLKVDAANQQFLVELEGQLIKAIPIKGLQNQMMPFEQYLDFICQQAVSNWRLYRRKQLKYLPLAA